MSFGLTDTILTFERLKEIGQEGRNSQVYLAHDKQQNADLVVKQIPKASFKDPDLFFAEAQKLYSSEHPFVVPIKYASQDNEYIYLAMPYFKNGSLKKRIDASYLTVREIVRYTCHFLAGLNHIHVNKLIHFDIKPDNILLTDADQAVVSDFGLAKNMNEFGMAEIDYAYYPHVPPEMWSETHQTMLFDVYAAGVTLYRMCNGNKRFDSQLNTALQSNDFQGRVEGGEFPDRNIFPPHIPTSLRRIIKKAMTPDRNKRYQSVLALQNDLATVEDFLDWKYEEKSGETEWVKDDEERKISIILKNLANSQCELTTLKTIKASGKTSRVTDGCIPKVDAKDAARVIANRLKAHD